MIASCGRVDHGRTSELSPRNDSYVVKHTALIEIFDQRAETLIEFAAVISHQVEVGPVAIPTPITEADNARSRFDESSSN